MNIKDDKPFIGFEENDIITLKTKCDRLRYQYYHCKLKIDNDLYTVKFSKRKPEPLKNPVTDEPHTVPFKYGWRREIVHRSSWVPTAHRGPDIYYYPPDSKKCRSYKDIEKYFIKFGNKNGLTKDNFTFKKQPIGPADNTKEIERRQPNKEH